jgi:protein phosphatase
VKLDIHYRTHVGKVRQSNEDAFTVWTPGDDSDQVFLAVADGMGGHPGGEIASKIAVDAAREMAEFKTGSDPLVILHAVFDHAAREIRNRAVREPRYREMGTTLTCVWYQQGHAYVGHIGDSRLYWFRSGRWTQVTVDHTMAQDLVESGKLLPEDAEEHPTSHVLTRCLGICPRQAPDILHGSLALRDGDTLLLASDGLGKTVHDETLAEMVGSADPARAGEWMVEAALAAGGPDNVTVVLARAAGESALQGSLGGPAHDLDSERLRLTWDLHL